MGYPKLGFSKWQEEDKKLNINQHYLLMQQQAGHIISESPVGLVGGGGGQIHQTWRCRASHSSVHSAGTSLKQRCGGGGCCRQGGNGSRALVCVCRCQGIRTNSLFTPSLNMPPAFRSARRSRKLGCKITP